MASFTDSPVQFNPYIQQQPVELMRNVGLIKEQQFQEGLSKVQSWIDNTLNLPIAKEETRQYVQNKVDELGNSLKTSISGDFSRRKVLNNVGGLIGQIANDPIVQNGVRSTAKITQAQADITQAKKDGKWSQQNEDFFNEGVNRWINDKDVETAFDGEYTPWIDYQKRFTEVYKELNKGDYPDDTPFQVAGYDSEGAPIFGGNRTVKEGISPDRIRAAWNMVASQPDVQKQLQIDGWAKYRGLDNQSIINNITENYNMSLKDIEKTINNLNTKVALGDNSEKTAGDIEQLKQFAVDRKTQLSKTLEALAKNPDTAKTMLQEQNVTSNLINAYSYEINKPSSLWNSTFQEEKLRLQTSQWNKGYALNLEKLKLSREKANEKDTDSDDSNVLPAPLEESQRGSSASAYASKNQAVDDFTQASLALVDAAAGISTSPVKNENGRWVYNVGRGEGQFKTEKEAEEEAKRRYAQLKDAHINGNITDPTIKAKAEDSENKFDNLSNWNKIIEESENAVKPQMEEIRNTIGEVNEKVNYKGKDINVTTSDLMDVYSIKNNLNNKESATERLNQKYGSSSDFISSEIDSKLTPSTTGPTSIYTRSPLTGLYNDISSKLKKNKDLLTANDQIEKEFASRQTALQSNWKTYGKSSKETDKNVQNFMSFVNNRVTPGAEKGPAYDMMQAIIGDKDAKNNVYFSRFDPNSNEGVLRVQTSKQASPIELRVPASEYFRIFPNQQVDNSFREKFGTRLSLGKGNTNYDNRGRAGGYQVDLPSSAPYTIQYHLKESGADQNGKLYEVYWWVTPKGEGKTSIIQGKVSDSFDNFPYQANTSQVMEMINSLKDKNFVDLIIKRNQKKASE